MKASIKACKNFDTELCNPTTVTSEFDLVGEQRDVNLREICLFDIANKFRCARCDLHSCGPWVGSVVSLYMTYTLPAVAWRQAKAVGSKVHPLLLSWLGGHDHRLILNRQYPKNSGD
ncbi:hypothetical protein RRG08_038892 [Elysia crispata]|uniref:Uncharacterized protein n=1 Tax=Elysia crispata TaxID=231223 RepID=A0AAE0Y6P1_9GAST|nr:hypothetical protein RRG08_038892 [Elysia crispata]